MFRIFLKLIVFFVYIYSLNFWGQDSLNIKILKLSMEMENKKIPMICQFSILDDNEYPNDFKKIGLIEIYNDSMVYHKFIKESNNEWSYSKKNIINKETIRYIFYYSLLFKKYVPKCTHYVDGGIPEICGIPLNKERMNKNIGYSNNEWYISFRSLEQNLNYSFTSSFKSKLLKFKCLGLIQNIKSRILFNKFLSKIEND